MGRTKGYIPTKEELEKRAATKARNKLLKSQLVIKQHEKPILKISRKWSNGFDFWPSIRNILRPLHRYTDCQMIERLIVNKEIWENREEIIKILKNYFIVELKKLKSSL